MKKFLVSLSLVATLLLTSCADSKVLEVNGQKKVVEPYGWADYDTVKQPGVKYRVCFGNIVLSVLLSESVVIPVWLTGWQFYEPVGYDETVVVNN